MQIAGGTSIKKRQALLGHKSAVETWDTYGHLIGDEDDRSRSVIQGALARLQQERISEKVRTVDPL
jgi:integrase